MIASRSIIISLTDYVVAVLEVVGAIALILGMGIRVVCVSYGLILIGAIVTVKGSAGFLGTSSTTGYELVLVLLGICISLVITGSKFLSLESVFKRWKGR